MARKKVNLDVNPLESVTIGRTDKKKYSWIGTVVLFILFILVIYFLPDIQKAYREYLYNKAFSNNTTNTIPSQGDNNDGNETVNNTNIKNTQIFSIDSNSNITIDNIIFNNLKYSENNISFEATSNSDNELNLSDEGYFLRLYDDDNIIKTIKINGVISAKASKSFGYLIDVQPTRYSIVKLDEKDYDLIMLSVDSENKSSLTCSNSNETVVYYFQDDLLYKLEDTVVYETSNANYSEMYSKYTSYVNSYSGKPGIETSLSSNSLRLNFTLSIDYLQFYQKIDNIYYYAKDTSPIKVNYEMNAMFFDCK